MFVSIGETKGSPAVAIKGVGYFGYAGGILVIAFASTAFPAVAGGDFDC